MARRPLRRALNVAGWSVFIVGLVVLWRDPGLVQRARHATRSRAAAASDCRPEQSQACTASFDDGLQVNLSIPSGPPRTGTVLTWQVRTTGPQVLIEGLEITGLSMPMGVTTVVGSMVSVGPERTWQGQGSLPICTATHMLWRVDVLLQSLGRDRIASFQIDTGDDLSPPPAQRSEPHGAAAAGAGPPTHLPFQVDTATGPLALGDLRGRVVLLNFGYTTCPDVCPTTLAQLSQAVQGLSPAEQDRIAGLMVSLDPDRDSLEHLAAYTAHFSPAFQGGTLAPDQLDTVTADWGVAWRRTPLPGSALGYVIDHGTESFLVGTDGHLIGTIPLGTPVADITAQLRAALEP